MPRPVAKYGVTDGARFYYFIAPKEVYSALKDELGWEEDTSGKINERMHPSTARRVRIALSLAPASGSSRTGSGALYAELSKVEEALAALPGKTYNGRNIISARIPRDVTYS